MRMCTAVAYAVRRIKMGIAVACAGPEDEEESCSSICR